MGLGEAFSDDVHLVSGWASGSHPGSRRATTTQPLVCPRFSIRSSGEQIGKIAERDPELWIEDAGRDRGSPLGAMPTTV